ncbi:MAG: hypothetical protein LBP78_07395 [Acidaminococcales bacterium]|jgi:biotin carboxyl carrier protein|nr:hypothetical protein [Acidaminococcales bacterium]
MLQRKWVIGITAAFLLVFAQWGYAAGGLVDQPSTLSGKVSAKGFAAQGGSIREGQPLLLVESVAGAAVAARATVSGIIADILVKPGDMIKSGQIDARIKPSA